MAHMEAIDMPETDIIERLKDIIERLNKRAENGRVFHTDRKLFAEAATALSEKDRRIVMLGKDRGSWKQTATEYAQEVHDLRARLASCEAEKERLRKALNLDAAISNAAVTWCGEKDRETSLDDIHYFEGNWSALAGLTPYVDRELGRAARAALTKGGEDHA